MSCRPIRPARRPRVLLLALVLTAATPVLAGPGGPASGGPGVLGLNGLPAVIGAREHQASDPRSGLALSGYDPVAYLTDERPRAGRPEFEATHDGVAWRFASEANRQAFLRDPEAFRPRTGGYDAVAAARGRVVAADPLVFAVSEGRLYLFRNPDERRRFLADAELRREAEAGWPRLAAGLVGG